MLLDDMELSRNGWIAVILGHDPLGLYNTDKYQIYGFPWKSWGLSLEYGPCSLTGYTNAMGHSSAGAECVRLEGPLSVRNPPCWFVFWSGAT